MLYCCNNCSASKPNLIKYGETWVWLALFLVTNSQGLALWKVLHASHGELRSGYMSGFGQWSVSGSSVCHFSVLIEVLKQYKFCLNLWLCCSEQQCSGWWLSHQPGPWVRILLSYRGSELHIHVYGYIVWEINLCCFMPLNFEGVAFVTAAYPNVSWQIHPERLENSKK